MSRDRHYAEEYGTPEIHSILAVESQTARLADEVADLVDLLRIGIEVDADVAPGLRERLVRFDADRRARREARDA